MRSSPTFVLALAALIGACDAPRQLTGPGVIPKVYSTDEPGGPGECSDSNPCDELPTGPIPAGSSGILISGITPALCTDGDAADADADGFEDHCEHAIAQTYRPELRFTSGDDDVSREPYWAARYKHDSDGYHRLSVVYLLAYHRDTGALGHAGDSEFIILDLQHEGGGLWNLASAYLSAHWRADWDRSSTVWGGEMQVVPTPNATSNGGRPLVYVAKGKHANYHSAQACNQNGDICGPDHFSQEAEVFPDRNVGSSHAQLKDCITSQLPNRYPDYLAYECFWTPKYFTGWLTSPDSHAGVYRDVLDFFESRAAAY